MTLIDSSTLATSSEGGIIELWTIDATNKQLTARQHIFTPAETLWSIVALDNGDIAVGAR